MIAARDEIRPPSYTKASSSDLALSPGISGGLYSAIMRFMSDRRNGSYSSYSAVIVSRGRPGGGGRRPP